MTNDPPKVISRKRHYYYVLIFSLALWISMALSVGGFIPLKYGCVGECDCGTHKQYVNISFLVYGIGGIIAGLAFSFPLNRWMLVANSKPDNMEVPLSSLARYGNAILGRKGLFLLLLIAAIYICGDFIAHNFFFIHKEDRIKQEAGVTIHCAAAHGDYDKVYSELEKDSGVILNDGSYDSILNIAVRFGHKDIVALLLDKGADVKGKGFLNHNSLCTAALLGYEEIAQLLIDSGVDVNAEGGTTQFPPLHAAVRFGYEDVIVLLLDRGAEINKISNNCRTPLDYAFSDEIKTFLRARGAKTWNELRKKQEKE